MRYLVAHEEEEPLVQGPVERRAVVQTVCQVPRYTAQTHYKDIDYTHIYV